MPRSARALTTLILALFCAACGAAIDPPLRPASVGHLDTTQKEEYILRTKTTLKTFHAAAADLRSRELSVPLRELGENFNRYAALQVAPIIEDAEARNSLATRMEIAQITLLCGLIYVDLDDNEKLGEVLRQLEDYGGDPGFMNTPIDRGDLGLTTMKEGVNRLKESFAETPSRGAVKPSQQASASRKDSL